METSNDLLSDLEQDIYREPAGLGLRFANYIIDVIGFYALLFIVGILLGFAELQTSRGESDTITGHSFTDLLLIAAIFLSYYTVFEGATKGRTLGKLITGTIVIQEDGSPITWNQALMRSLSRIVPFEPFSALGGRPWHDSWTHTVVVKKRN